MIRYIIKDRVVPPGSKAVPEQKDIGIRKMILRRVIYFPFIPRVGYEWLVVK